MELTNEQKAKVFAMYLGCEARPNKGVEHFKYILESILSNGKAYHLAISDSQVTTVKYPSEFKLLLRPLSVILPQDSIEVCKMLNVPEPEKVLEEEKDIVATCFGTFNYDVADNDYHPFVVHSVYQYLIQQGYAVPLFIAPGHPLNGKTAIELGLAIEQPA